MACAGADSPIPNAFLCPITTEIMRDPVFTADGHAYERRFITQWLRTKNTSPITNAELANQTLTPAHALRNAIQEWEMQYFKIIARPNLTPPSFDQETLISRGSFKEVHKGQLTVLGIDHPISVAVLRVRLGSVTAEADVLLKLGRHPNLVRFYGTCHDGNDQLLVTEFAELGSVKDLMSRLESGSGQAVPSAHKLTILQQVVSGMTALTDAELIHRDLAIRNILVCGFDLEDVTRTLVKVADFGLAVECHTAHHTTIENGERPVRYLAPEALRKGWYSEKSDVWGLGVLGWELLTDGCIPYNEVPNDELVVQHVYAGHRLPRPPAELDGEFCSNELWATLKSCWAEEPSARPSFSQLAVRFGQLGHDPTSPTTFSEGGAEASAESPTERPGTRPTSSTKSHKVIFLGDQNVGKTAILTRFVRDSFDTSYKATIGMEYLAKSVPVGDRLVRLQLWDTAGQERFRSLTPFYIRGAAAAVIVYSISFRQSFEQATAWIKEAQKLNGSACCNVLVGNKADLQAQREVTTADGEALARTHNVAFLETSAKTGHNVEDLFRTIAATIPPDDGHDSAAASIPDTVRAEEAIGRPDEGRGWKCSC